MLLLYDLTWKLCSSEIERNSPQLSICGEFIGEFTYSLSALQMKTKIYQKKKKNKQTQKPFKIQVKARMEVGKQILAANHQTHNFTLYKHLNKQNHAV